MPRLHDLRRERAAEQTRLREMKAELRSKLEELPVEDELPADAADLTERIAACEARCDKLDARIAALEAVEAEEGETAEPVGGGGDEEADFTPPAARDHRPRLTPHGYGEPAPRQDRGFKAAQFAIGVLVARSAGMQGAATWVSRRFGREANDVAKALNTAGVATGGALIPQDFAREVIELLRAAAVIRQCQPTVVEMPLGNLTIPRVIAGATAAYQGELDDIVASQPSFDDLQLNAKKLTALVPVSNDLIRRGSNNIEQIVRDDMIQALQRREDLAFMLGDGSGGSPVGLLNLAAPSMKLIAAPFAANADNAALLAHATGVLLGMKLMLETNFSRMIRPRWVSTPLVEAFLLGMRDGTGTFIWRDELLNKGTLMGIPFFKTQQLPSNVTVAALPSGTLNDGSYIFLADFADVILAETMNLSVDASDVASYKDGGGNMVSTFARDQTAFRIIEEHDFNIRHQASVAVGLLPAWAPAGWTNWSAGGAYYIQAPNGHLSAAPSTWGLAAPTGSNNPGNIAATVPGGTQPGIA